MAKIKVTISELLGIQKQVKERYNELCALRNENSAKKTTYYGQHADKPVDVVPKYDVVKLDKLIASLAREQRLIDVALKNANATIVVPTYEWDDDVLGELEAANATV